MAAVSLGYDGYSQSLSGPMDVRGRNNSYGDSSSSSGDDSSWSDWEAETDGQVHQARPPVVKVSDEPTQRVVCRKKNRRRNQRSCYWICINKEWDRVGKIDERERVRKRGGGKGVEAGRNPYRPPNHRFSMYPQAATTFCNTYTRRDRVYFVKAELSVPRPWTTHNSIPAGQNDWTRNVPCFFFFYLSLFITLYRHVGGHSLAVVTRKNKKYCPSAHYSPSTVYGLKNINITGLSTDQLGGTLAV